MRADGTSTSRALWIDTGELWPGVDFPPAWRDAVQQARDRNAEDDLAAELDPAGGVDGPLMYWRQTESGEGEAAELAGLLLRDGDCLYVHDEINRYPLLWPYSGIGRSTRRAERGRPAGTLVRATSCLMRHTVDRGSPLAESAEQKVDPSRGWRSAPGRMWLAVLAASLLLMLWAISYPGFAFLPMLIVLWSLAVLELIWVIRFIGWMTDERRGRGWRWCIAPAMVVAVLVLTVTQVPLRLRFEVARGEFDEMVDGLQPQGSFDEWEPLSVPDSIGGYSITDGYQVGDNVILYEANGWLFDDAGFAYLPNGPDARLDNGGFEAPSFQNLGGGWYAWQASW